MREGHCQNLCEGVPERKACLVESGAVSWASMSLFHTISLGVDSSFRQEPESFSGLI